MARHRRTPAYEPPLELEFRPDESKGVVGKFVRHRLVRRRPNPTT
jgi:hypothetical protein